MVKCKTCNNLEYSVDENYYCSKGHFCEVIDLQFKSKEDAINYICADRYCSDHSPEDWDEIIDSVRMELVGGNNDLPRM